MPANREAFMPDALFWAENSDPNMAEAVEAAPLESEIGDRLSDAEARLLSITPATPAEMVIQLEVICDGLESGGRSDGLDIRALRNIQSVLALQEAEDRGTLQRFSTLRRRNLAPSEPEG